MLEETPDPKPYLGYRIEAQHGGGDDSIVSGRALGVSRFQEMENAGVAGKADRGDRGSVRVFRQTTRPTVCHGDEREHGSSVELSVLPKQQLTAAFAICLSEPASTQVARTRTHCGREGL